MKSSANPAHSAVCCAHLQLSSAHVYLRLPKGDTIKDVPPEIVEECAQLTKFNSIEGCVSVADELLSC